MCPWGMFGHTKRLAFYMRQNAPREPPKWQYDALFNGENRLLPSRCERASHKVIYTEAEKAESRLCYAKLVAASW